jgi:hypothetical protein
MCTPSDENAQSIHSKGAIRVQKRKEPAMQNRLKLPEKLAHLCVEVCNRCGPTTSTELPISDGNNSCHEALIDATPDIHKETVRKRLVNLPLPKCSRCDFPLLLHAIEDLIPVEDLATWLNEPNLDLSSRSPRQCIDQNDYSAVFHALWFVYPTTAVS